MNGHFPQEMKSRREPMRTSCQIIQRKRWQRLQRSVGSLLFFLPRRLWQKWMLRRVHSKQQWRARLKHLRRWRKDYRRTRDKHWTISNSWVHWSSWRRWGIQKYCSLLIWIFRLLHYDFLESFWWHRLPKEWSSPHHRTAKSSNSSKRHWSISFPTLLCRSFQKIILLLW